ncbi:MAG: cell wall surface anchor family protein motif, partial [Clostridiaceae bacterium]|nr:cell wall surface anchor family protein motif [Clostridiaceae bacterium]
DGYILNDTTSKQIIINANSLNVEVVFNYTQIGSVTINYLDNSNNVIAPQSVNSNLTVGQTYNYSPILINGYSTTDIAKDIIISNDNLNQIINFVYTQIKGTLTVKYQNSADNTDIATEKVENNLDWNSYTENSIDIDEYTISGNNTHIVTINADNLNPVAIFTYTKNPVGSVTINYIDDVNNTSIQDATVNNNLALDTYSYDAPEISGYILSTTDTSPKSVTLTSDNLNQTIEFIYTVNPS